MPDPSVHYNILCSSVDTYRKHEAMLEKFQDESQGETQGRHKKKWRSVKALTLAVESGVTSKFFRFPTEDDEAMHARAFRTGKKILASGESSQHESLRDSLMTLSEIW